MYTEVPKGWTYAFNAYKQSMSEIAPKAIHSYFNAYYLRADSDARYAMRGLNTTEKRYEFLKHNRGSLTKMGYDVDSRINFNVRQDLRRTLKTEWFEGFVDRAESILRKGTNNDRLRSQAMEVMWHLNGDKNKTYNAIGEAHRELTARETYLPSVRAFERHLTDILKMKKSERKGGINRIMRLLNEAGGHMGMNKSVSWRNNMRTFQAGLESIALRGSVTGIRLSTFLLELSRTQTFQQLVDAGNRFAQVTKRAIEHSSSVAFVNALIALCWPLVLVSLALNIASGNYKTTQGIGRTAGNIAYTFGLIPLTAARLPESSTYAITPLVKMARMTKTFFAGLMSREATAAATVLPTLVNVTAEAVGGANGGLSAAERAAAITAVQRSTSREVARKLVNRAASKMVMSKALLGIGDIVIGATTLYAGVEDAKAGHVRRSTATIIAGSAAIVSGIFAAALIGATTAGAAATIAGLGFVFTTISMGAAVAATFIKD